MTTSLQELDLPPTRRRSQFKEVGSLLVAVSCRSELKKSRLVETHWIWLKFCRIWLYLDNILPNLARYNQRLPKYRQRTATLVHGDWLIWLDLGFYATRWSRFLEGEDPLLITIGSRLFDFQVKAETVWTGGQGRP